MRSLLVGVPVSRVMTPDPVTVPATALLADFLAEGPFGRYRHSAFPVLAADGSVTGVITLRRVDATPSLDRARTMVHEVMRPLGDIVTAAPEDPVLDVLPRLEASPLRRALIVDEGRLVGILTIADITRALAWPPVLWPGPPRPPFPAPPHSATAAPDSRGRRHDRPHARHPGASGPSTGESLEGPGLRSHGTRPHRRHRSAGRGGW